MYYITILCYRKVHSKDHIVESTALPADLIRSAGGQVAFEESGPRVSTTYTCMQYVCEFH